MVEIESIPQGLLYRVEKDQELLAAPRSTRQKIIEENHDVLIIGHVCIHRTMDHIKREF